eukprot:2373018-Pyramimonas_sp.AAC.1
MMITRSHCLDRCEQLSNLARVPSVLRRTPGPAPTSQAAEELVSWRYFLHLASLLAWSRRGVVWGPSRAGT